MFALKQARFSYNGQVALVDISLTIEAGERVSLLGRSGAGKSTLLHALREQQPAGAALIPQNTALVPGLSVFHNVYMGRLNRYSTFYNLRNLVHPSARERERMQPLLTRLGLLDKLHTPCGELSGGQQQRTAVGRALYQGAQVLLGDEPVSAVDGLQARSVLDCINEHYDTIVLAMHDVELALRCSDRIIGLKGGRLVLDAAAQTLTSADLDFLYSHDGDSPSPQAATSPTPITATC